MPTAGPFSEQTRRRDAPVVQQGWEQYPRFRPAPAMRKSSAGVGRGKRLAAFDALRGGAMLLGVCLHGAIPYMPSRMPGLLWVVQDESTSPLFDLVFWWVHAFRLPLFFLVAGFFAQALYQTRGPHAFLAHRYKRLLIPFLLGSLVLLPVGFAVWACGWLATGSCTIEEVRALHFRPEIQAELWGPMHLWFLEDLIILSLIFFLIRQVLAGRGSPQLVLQDSLLPSRSARHAMMWPLALAIPGSLILWSSLHTIVGYHNSFVPDGVRLLYYGLFFAGGSWLYAHWRDLPTIFRFPGTHLVTSVLATAAVMLLLPSYLTGHLNDCGRLALAASIALVAWTSIFGFIGLSLRWLDDRSAIISYLADASYWIYLCHLPLIGLLQLNLHGLAVGAELKFAIVVGGTLVIGLASYHACVRYTPIGLWLHGHR